MKTGNALCRSVLLLAVALALSCGRAPRVQPGLAAEPTLPAVPSGFLMKPFQVSMSEEMRKSYEQADEIMIGIFAGTYEDEQHYLIYYFRDFNLFDRETLSWGPTMDVIVQIKPGRFKPEIIGEREFKRLIALDKVGICWDNYEGNRSVYLVEGQKNLVFLEVGLDDVNSESYRKFIDAYPATRECRAVDVFNLTIRRFVEGEKD